MNDNRTLRDVFGECLATRGPFYRKVCVRVAELVSRVPNDLLGDFNNKELAIHRMGYRDGCMAVADAIRSIDDPSVELKGNLADWNKVEACKKVGSERVAELEREVEGLKAENERLKSLEQDVVDENETTWSRPTAWAYMQSCKAFNKAKERIAALETGCRNQDDEIRQVLGKALGFMWYKDDQENFPGATEANGVFTGEHVAETMADVAAACILHLKASNKRLLEAIGWALGEGDSDFDKCEPEHPGMIRYWWRSELRKRSGVCVNQEEPGNPWQPTDTELIDWIEKEKGH